MGTSQRSGTRHHPLMGHVPEWRHYERQIYERLKRGVAADATVTFDKGGRLKRVGKYSKTPRQVDVLVRGKFAGLPRELDLIVDCKHWSKLVDVPEVDSFIGFLLDVHVGNGLLVTSKGFTPAAQRRAENQGTPVVTVDVVKFDRLAVWRPWQPTIAWTIGTDTATFTKTRDGETITETVPLGVARDLYREMYGRELDDCLGSADGRLGSQCDD